MSRSAAGTLSRITKGVLGALLLLLVGLGIYLLPRLLGLGPSAADAGGNAPRDSDTALVPPPSDVEDQAHQASVRGTVLDSLGHPADGALVWASDGAGHLRQARTTADGSFALPHLPPGQYRIAAQRGAETSDAEGPLPLGEGDDLRDLVLKLAPGARIAGAVFDLTTRSPLAGAVVAVMATPLSAIADGRGRFALPPLPPGGHQLAVQADGHLSRQLPLLARSGDDTRDLEIFLTPASKLSGLVLTKDGTGVPGAQLLLSRYQASADGALLLPAGAITDEVGHFALEVAPGLLRLVARSPGFAEAESDMLELSAGKPREVKLTLGAGAQVNGTVLSTDGQPVNGGQTAAFRDGAGWQVGSAPIGPGGTFTLTGLPAGHLTISADAMAARATAQVDLEEGGAASVQLRLGDRSLQGVVVGSADEPVEGALVVARPIGAGEAGERSGLSTTDGSFKISGLSGDRFDLAATKDEGTAELRGVAAGRHDVRLSLAAGGVSGTVLGPGGNAVSDFYLAAEPEVPGHGRPRALQAVDARGAFHLSLTPGRYRLRARAPGYAEGQLDDVEVSARAETRGVRVELRPAGTIEGVVVDDKAGSPLPGVHVATDRGHAWSVGRDNPLGGSGAVTGADGHFTLRDVAPGNWPVFASAATLDPVAGTPLVDVEPGKNPAPIEIRMRHTEGEDPQLYAGIGMSLYPEGDRKFAGEVFVGGPAHAAGIRSGDEILAIDGASTAALTIGDLAGRIRGPQGSEATLDLRRGKDGEGYTVIVPRAEIRF